MPLLLIILALFSAGCPSKKETPELEPTPLVQLVEDVTLDVWAEEGFPEPGERCVLNTFQTEVAADDDAFYEGCRKSVYLAQGCLVWRVYNLTPDQPKNRHWRPTALVRPGTDDKTLARLAVHELLHLLVYCIPEVGGHDDPYDAAHALEGVWDRVEVEAKARL